MNYKCVTYGGGGIFSILMDLVIPHLYMLRNIENVYIEVMENEYGCMNNGFDYVFDQQYDESYKVLNCGFIGHIEPDKRVKEICKKFKPKINIKDKYDLGVHYRGVDMDRQHGNYGIIGFNDYKRRIDRIIKIDSIKSIFVASDNFEAANQFVGLYDNKAPTYYHTDFIRAESLQDDTLQTQIENSGKPELWEQVFTDMLTLANCKSLLCRRSNFSNAAIAFSDTLTKIYRL